MSKSYRKPAYFQTVKVDTKTGKKETTRAIRNLEKYQKYKALYDYFFDDFFINDIRDRNRGYGGSTSTDYGWSFFGDGKIKPAYNRKEDFRGEHTWRKLITK
jgi:hypothetical protein